MKVNAVVGQMVVDCGAAMVLASVNNMLMRMTSGTIIRWCMCPRMRMFLYTKRKCFIYAYSVCVCVCVCNFVCESN